MRTERDDPEIAHFTQADIVIPGAGNPATWNRYAYTLYNPLRYTDPSGHWSSKRELVAVMLLEKRYQRYTNMYSADEYQTTSTTPTPSPSPTPTPLSPTPVLVTTPNPSTPVPPFAADNISMFAFSISSECDFGFPGFGNSVGIGFVFKDGTHLFTEIGESSYVGAEASCGIEFGFDWDTETISDFEGAETEIGFSFVNGIGGSIAFSVEMGEGLLGIVKITGISISPELGYGFSGFWNMMLIDVLDY